MKEKELNNKIVFLILEIISISVICLVIVYPLNPKTQYLTEKFNCNEKQIQQLKEISYSGIGECFFTYSKKDNKLTLNIKSEKLDLIDVKK